MGDPAFLFYTSDFLTGTMLMTNEQVGKYIRIMCYEHQHGRLTEEDMLKICQTYDKDIFCKFIKDENGLYYNPRLEEEKNKRKAYSESRKANRSNICKTHDKHMSNICKTYVEHMENENENINVDVIDSKKGVVRGKRFEPPTVEEIGAYCSERDNKVNPQAFFDFYESKGWVVGNQKMKDWKAAVRTWEQRESESKPPQKKTSYLEDIANL